MCIVVNDISQDCTAKHLSWNELLHYKFVIQFAGKKIILFKSVNIWRSYKQMVDCVVRPIRLRLLSSNSKMQNSLDK